MNVKKNVGGYNLIQVQKFGKFYRFILVLSGEGGGGKIPEVQEPNDVIFRA